MHRAFMHSVGEFGTTEALEDIKKLKKKLTLV